MIYRDTKSKTVEYWGSENSKVVVGNSETVKPISMTMVKKLLGDVFKDFVKEDVLIVCQPRQSGFFP